MSWQPRCKRCHRVLTNDDNIKHGYGPTCFLKTFGYRPRKPKLRIQKVKGYVNFNDIPPLFAKDLNFLGREGVEMLGTLTVKNLSSITDRAALALAADYYNHRDDKELEDTMNSLNVRVIKKGHKFTIVDCE